MAEFVADAAETGDLRGACKRANISMVEYRRARGVNPAFDAACLEVDAALRLGVADAMLARAIDGDTKAARSARDWMEREQERAEEQAEFVNPWQSFTPHDLYDLLHATVLWPSRMPGFHPGLAQFLLLFMDRIQELADNGECDVENMDKSEVWRNFANAVELDDGRSWVWWNNCPWCGLDYQEAWEKHRDLYGPSPWPHCRPRAPGEAVFGQARYHETEAQREYRRSLTQAVERGSVSGTGHDCQCLKCKCSYEASLVGRPPLCPTCGTPLQPLNR